MGVHIHTPVGGHLYIMTKDDFGTELINIIYISLLTFKGVLPVRKTECT